MRKQCLGLLVFALMTTSLVAQSNQALDDILAAHEASYGQAAYLLLSARGMIGEEADYAAAVDALQAAGMAIEQRGVNEAINLGEYVFLVQQLFDLPRGVLGSLLGGPRYATRDLRFLRIVQGRSYPNMSISGERMMRILGRTLAYKDGVL